MAGMTGAHAGPMKRLVVLLAVAGCSGGGDDDPIQPPEIVETDSGAVRGVHDGALFAFRGIPYAAPPIGDLRFRPPEPPAAWDGVRDATAFGSVCVQPDNFTGSNWTYLGSEDCLTINVWTPDPSPDAELPVLFYIHGGGYFIGSGSGLENDDPALEIDPRHLVADRRAVVVTINYRLGILGFLVHPALAAASGYGGSGNYGFMDQILALRWVKSNIREFGGDPQRVMVFGVSAGGGSTGVMVASPQAAGLVSSAILESPSGMTYPRAEQEAQGNRIAMAASCATAADVIACLRAMDAKTLADVVSLSYQHGVGEASFGPTVDGYILPRTQMDMFAAGEHNHMPLVIGTTAEEFSWLIWGVFPTPITSDTEYRATLEAVFGATAADGLFALYPPGDYPSYQDALSAIYSDFTYTCPAREIARRLSASQDEEVRRYIYTHTFHGGPYAAYRAGHGFDDLTLWGYSPQLDAQEQAMGDTMRRYWHRFAATGSPEGAGDPAWPTYDAATDRYFAIDTPMAVRAGYRTVTCDAWEPWVTSYGR